MKFALVSCTASAMILLGQPLSAQRPNVSIRVSDKPMAEVGEDPNAGFTWIEDAVVFGESLVVSDSRAAEVSRFNRQGHLTGVVGGSGSGPGEFVKPTSLQVDPSGDSLYVFDPGALRISVFDTSWELVRVDFLGTPFAVEEVLRMADGNWFIMRDHALAATAVRTVARDTVPTFISDPSFSSPRHLKDLPGTMSTAISRAGSGRVFKRRAAFSPVPLVAVSGNCIFLTAGDAAEIELFGSDGQPIKSFNTGGVRRRVTKEAIEGWIEMATEMFPEGERGEFRRAARRDLGFPEHFPLYDGLLIDPEGLIWLQHYDWTGWSDQVSVFSADGGVLAKIRLPERLQVMDVGVEHLLGVRTDEFGIQSVQWYGLSRSYLDAQGSAHSVQVCSE